MSELKECLEHGAGTCRNADMIDQLRAELGELWEDICNYQAELARRDEIITRLKEDAEIGIYGIDQKAFTMIDQFITHYNDAVSAGKVSVDVKRELSDAEINELGAQEAEKRGEK